MLPTVSDSPSIAFFEIVRQHRRESDERLKLPRLFFTRDLRAQTFGDDVDVVGEAARVVTRLQDDATVQFAFCDRRQVFGHARDSARSSLHVAF